MGLGVPGMGTCVGSATLSLCCAPRYAMVRAAGMQGREKPFLTFTTIARGPNPGTVCVPANLDPSRDEPGPCLHHSLHLLLPQRCFPLGSSSSTQPQSLLLLPERLTQHCIKWSVCLMDITMHLLQPDLGFF